MFGGFLLIFQFAVIRSPCIKQQASQEEVTNDTGQIKQRPCIISAIQGGA